MSDEFRDSDKKTLYTESITVRQLLTEINNGITDFCSWNFSDQDLSYLNLCLMNISTLELPSSESLQKQSTKLDFTQAIFAGANVKHVNFNEAILIDANFTNANLEGAIFTNANLKGANFTNANLKGADFTNAKNLEYVDFTNANLEGAIFSDKSILSNKTLSHTQKQQIRKSLQKPDKGCCIMM